MPNFLSQLISNADQSYSKDHLFFDLWAEGKLSEEQTVVYCSPAFSVCCE